MPQLLHSRLSDALIGSFYDVYRELRGGLLEEPYCNALVIREKGNASVREAPLDVYFHGQVVGHYRMDLVVADRIVIECKTAKSLDASHEAQLLNYLHATRMPLGFLLNFGQVPSFKRMIYDRNNPTRPKIDEAW